MTHVVFKNLGIDVTMSRRLISFPALGGGIYYYAVIIVAGLFLAWFYINHKEKSEGGDPEHLVNMLLLGLPCAIVSARAYYVIFSLSEYTSAWDMIKVWEGGLAIYGGIIGAVLAVWIYCRVNHLCALHYFDLALTGFMIGQCIGRWGNFVNGEAYGRLCSDSFLLGMYVNGEGPFHPAFLYESALNLLGFILLAALSKSQRYTGFRTAFYCVWYGVIRFFIEGLRTDSLMLGPVRVSQMLSAALVLSGIILFAVVSRKGTRHDPEPLSKK